jgi:hypothetical protein
MARLAITHCSGRSTNNPKVRYIIDDDAAVLTQNVLNMKGHNLVVRTKNNDEIEVNTTYHSTFI